MRFNANIATVLSESAGEQEATLEVQQRPVRSRSLVREAAPSTLVWALAAAGVAAAVLLAVLSTGPEEPPRKPKSAPLVKKTEPREAPQAPAPVPKPPEPPREPRPAPAPVAAPENPRRDPPAPQQPQPASAPEAPPAPVPAPAPVVPQTTKAEVAVAVVDSVKGEAKLRTSKGPEAVKEGQSLLEGQGIEVGAGESSASLRLADGSRLELAAESRLDRITNGDGKRIALDLGVLTADIRKQAPGQPLIILTPQAEARVLGTRFTLTVKGDSTRLEVLEGRVRLTRLSDGSSTDVGAGSFAVAAPGPRPASKRLPANNPRLLLAEDFENPSGVDARWQALADGFPTTTRGRLEVDLSPRAADAYTSGGWHLPGGLRPRQGFAVPFRLSVDVEVTAKHDNLNAVVALAPASVKVGGVRNEVAARLRGAEYAILIENTKAKTSAAGGAFPLRTRWVIELDRQELRFWVDGKEIGRQAHGLTITEDYKFELQGAAKADVPAGARVIFDNVKVEPLDR